MNDLRDGTEKREEKPVETSSLASLDNTR